MIGGSSSFDELGASLAQLAGCYDPASDVDLAPAVRARIATTAGRRRRRRWIVGALVAVATGGAGVGAVGAASGWLDTGWFEVGRTRVGPEPTEPFPARADALSVPPPVAASLPPGERVPPGETDGLVRPRALGPPDEIDDDPDSRRVTMTWRGRTGGDEVRFSQRAGDGTSPLITKLVDPEALADVEQVLVGRSWPGLWIAVDHRLVLGGESDEPTVMAAGPTLLWEVPGVDAVGAPLELRLEGIADRDEALAIAADLVPHRP